MYLAFGPYHALLGVGLVGRDGEHELDFNFNEKNIFLPPLLSFYKNSLFLFWQLISKKEIREVIMAH